ncbi:MAG TPA: GNAT family N-acetyltransferase [Actinotalea sp.]|nr:GNAT family N-acetyltransferase [Actinotalea sp.]
MHQVPASLPPAWRRDRLLLGDRGHGALVEVRGDDRAVLVVLDRPGRVTLLGRGAADAVVHRLVELVGDPSARSLIHDVGWMSVPRGAVVPPSVLVTLGLTAFSTWDWMATQAVPPGVDGEDAVVRLDRTGDAPAIRACLEAANPGTAANPQDRGEVGWWGVRGPSGLVGVVGAVRRAGDPHGRDASWHLHGLGVRPAARRQGLGAALTAAATRSALDGAADWVSLGHYAQNVAARRVYRRLGFVTEGEFASFGPPRATHPPA